ncbi:tetratricopeptide repeat protein [Nocardioides sp. CFH 31398]|uniref:tetratricopeptide repeat protein n=1 Tax=Nocardioides sp. CFH 31398 TaxID=2919579 RepID=UPI001F061917|nr:tetratricopeptide repeat protein [Nocardioides sp. CFH 31398]MCH1866805.1 tetratricopeptide repeat protein [Nocardioides sp. CFH 31398]
MTDAAGTSGATGGHDPADRAEILLDLGRHADARREVEAALAADPSSPYLHGLHAQALHGLGSHTDALAAAERVTALAPDRAAGHRQRAVSLLRLERTPEALAAAHEAVRLEPQHWLHHALLAQIAAEQPATLRLAWDAAMRTVELAPEVADAHFTVGFVAGHRRDHRTAVAAYQRALALDPGHATAVHNLTLLQSGGDVRRVAEGIGGALRLDPQREDFRATLDDVTRRTVVRAWASTVVGSLVTLVAAPATDPRQPVVTVAALTVAVLAVWWGYTLRSLPVGVRRHAQALVRAEPPLVVLLVVAVLGLAVIAVAVAFPGTGVVGLAALAWTLGAGLPALVWLRSRVRP